VLFHNMNIIVTVNRPLDVLTFVCTVLFLHAQRSGRVLPLNAPVEKCAGFMAPIACSRAINAPCYKHLKYALSCHTLERRALVQRKTKVREVFARTKTKTNWRCHHWQPPEPTSWCFRSMYGTWVLNEWWWSTLPSHTPLPKHRFLTTKDQGQWPSWVNFKVFWQSKGPPHFTKRTRHLRNGVWMKSGSKRCPTSSERKSV